MASHPSTNGLAIGGLASWLGLGDDVVVPLSRHADWNGGVAAIEDVAAAVRAALAEPLEFPPLRRAIVPGDRVAIAVDEAVPRVGEIVAAAIGSLVEMGIEADAVSVVGAASLGSTLDAAEAMSQAPEGWRFVAHDPANQQNLCFVGTAESGRTLLINRTLFEADLILPIGCARHERALGHGGPFETLFPRFSDAPTISRLRAPRGLMAPDAEAERRRETDHAGWQLGAAFTMSVVPGAEGSVAHVAAGEPRAVARFAAEQCRAQWTQRVPRRSSLVIAHLSGKGDAIGWDDLARALAAAEQVLDDDGAVAVWGNLQGRAGASLQRLIRAEDPFDAEHAVVRDGGPDSWSAWQLARALQRGPVYLLSELDTDMLEELGLAPVEHQDELARLARRHGECILLDGAQHVQVAVAGEEGG